MNSNTLRDPLLDVQAQVNALHRAVARQRTLVWAFGLGLAAVLAWNLLSPGATTRAVAQDKGAMEITCRALKLVDDKGVVRVQLSYDKFGGIVQVNNTEGKKVATLEADGDGGFVSLLGHDGKERAFVGVGDKQSGGLIYLKDNQGKNRANFLVYQDGNGGLTFRNAQGKQEAFFGVSAKGLGGLVNLNGPDGKSRLILDTDKDGHGAVEMINNDDKTEIFLGSSAKGMGGLININGPNGTAGVILDIDDKGIGRMNLRTREAKRLVFAGGDEEGGTYQVYGFDGKQRAFLGVGDKQTGGVFYLLNPDNNKARIAGGVDNNGVGYLEGRDANGDTKRALR